MQMKHLLVALLVLLALVGTAVAADDADVVSAESVDIRSTIMHFDVFTHNATNGTTAPLTIWYLDALSWAGFYYNLDSNQSTESMIVAKNASAPNKIDIQYTTKPVFQAYDYDWKIKSGLNEYDAGYAMIGFFAEPYVALGSKNFNNNSALTEVKANKIAKLVIDSDERYTLKTGATLELGSGYSIVPVQIDVDGNKVQLKLMHDGQEINGSIANSGEDWAFDLTVLGEKNMQVMRVHVKSVFQGTESSLVEIEGIWMVDYLNAIEVKSDVDYGKFEASGIGSTQLVYLAKGISLNQDMSTDLGRGIFLKTEKDFAVGGHVALPATGDADKFYLLKQFTEEGKYEIRSQVYSWYTAFDGSAANAPSNGNFTYENFAAFYYDLDSNAHTETLTIKASTTEIADNDMVYTTTPKGVAYAYDDWGQTFYIMGFFGEKYVPLNFVDVNGVPKTTTPVKAEKMAKLVIDDDARYTLKTGATLELGGGYSIVPVQIDVDGNKVQLKFFKDGQEINGTIVKSGEDWFLRQKILGESDVQVLRVHVKSVFQGTESSLVEIEGLWLMDYINAKEVKSDDKVGVMEFSNGGTTLTFKNDGKITLTTDMDKLIANNMYLKTADNDTQYGKNYYLYVAATVGEPIITPPDNGDNGNTDVKPDEKPDEKPDVKPDEKPDEKPDVKPPQESFWSKYWKIIVLAIILIIIIAAAAYYFLVMKKQ
jgi:S-layer-related duplication domain